MNRFPWAIVVRNAIFSSLLFTTSLAHSAPQSQTTVDAKVDHPSVGSNKLRLTIADANGKPISGAKVTVDVGMSNMDMGTSHPSVSETSGGVYTTSVKFSMAGPWRVTVHVAGAGSSLVTKAFDFQTGGKGMPMKGMQMDGMDVGDMSMDSMKGNLGPWSMAKEGSGTSWLPESSPMFMKMLDPVGRYDLSLMGYFTLNYTNSGGPRGDERFFSNSMPMLMARRETGGGTIGMNLMMSLDPIFNGEYGYPNLFQTGETAYCHKLVDDQHPHNLVSELSASYSHPIANGVRAFVYGGPIGEPALGGPTFAHRPSGMEIPEAPITHHWFDSTHISNGVVTTGVNTDHWQWEGSWFNGHEPGENRYEFGPFALNSVSTRLTYNPTKNLSFNTSYGYLDSPESTAPGQGQNRFTVAAIGSLPMPHGDNLSVTAYMGRKTELGTISDAYVLEATYLTGPNSIFARWENVNETELPSIPPGSYRVNKILFGDVNTLATRKGYELGIGAYVGLYSFPGELDPYYGHSPVTLGVFLRLRPARMKMDH